MHKYLIKEVQKREMKRPNTTHMQSYTHFTQMLINLNQINLLINIYRIAEKIEINK